MKKVSQTVTVILSVTAGFFYIWMYNPQEPSILGIHIYLILCILGISSAFLSGLITQVEPEKNMLLTASGISLAVILSSILFGIELPHAANNEIIIMLFFTGHAALVGTYSSVIAKNLSLKAASAKLKGNKKSYLHYPVTEH